MSTNGTSNVHDTDDLAALLRDEYTVRVNEPAELHEQVQQLRDLLEFMPEEEVRREVATLLAAKRAETPADDEPEEDGPEHGGLVVELGDWAPQDLGVLGRERPKPPVWRGILYEATNHLIFGPFSASKTMAMVWCAVEVIEAGGVVLHLDVDGGHAGDLAERYLSFGLTEQQLRSPEDGGNLIYLRPSSKLGAQRAKLIAQLCRDHDVQLVIVDSAIGAFSLEGRDPDKAQDVNAWWQQIGDNLQGHRAAVVLIAHSGLAAEAQNRAAHSQRFATIAAVVYQLKTSEALRRAERGHDITGKTSIIVKKDRPSYHRVPRDTSLGTLEITSHCVRETQIDVEGNTVDPGEWTLSAQISEPANEVARQTRPTYLMERACRELEQAVDPMTKNALQKIVTGNRQFVGIAIDTLIREGYVRNNKPGQRGGVLEVIRAYRQDTDTTASEDDG
jgi:hypothetical protein